MVSVTRDQSNHDLKSFARQINKGGEESRLIEVEPLPDEPALAHVHRWLQVSSYRTRADLDRALQREISANSGAGAPGTFLYRIARASHLSPSQYARRHSMLGALFPAVGSADECAYGDEVEGGAIAAALLLFCANFSLVRKLGRRPPEERDRLLCWPLILLPLAANDPDWTAYLDAARSVEPDVLKFDPALDGKKIHDYTFGIKRKVVDLIEVAVKMARSRSADTTVGVDELLAAYRSAAYALHREDVEALTRQDITGKVEREDLVCPFTSTGTAATKIDAIPTAVEHFERRTEDAILADAMLPSEARAHQRLSSEGSVKRGAGKVVRFARQKITKEGLLEGAAALDALGKI